MINHHAVLYITDAINIVPSEVQEIETLHESARFFLPVISIKDVRTVIERAYQTPFASPYQYMIINTDSIPVEAQNALLKILEEPPVTTRFAVIVRPHTMLLPTLRSRFAVGAKSTGVTVNVFFREFIQSTIAQRFETIARIAKEKNEVQFQELYKGLLEYLVTVSPGAEKKVYEPLISYLQLRGASKKMIWEDIALRLPSGR